MPQNVGQLHNVPAGPVKHRGEQVPQVMGKDLRFFYPRQSAQLRTFREQKREITREDYRRLLDAAGERGQKRLALLMETICSTGIRVSEVRWITLEAARQGSGRRPGRPGGIFRWYPRSAPRFAGRRRRLGSRVP